MWSVTSAWMLRWRLSRCPASTGKQGAHSYLHAPISAQSFICSICPYRNAPHCAFSAAAVYLVSTLSADGAWCLQLNVPLTAVSVLCRMCIACAKAVCSMPDHAPQCPFCRAAIARLLRIAPAA